MFTDKKPYSEFAHNVVRDNKFPIEGGNGPLKLLPDRFLHHDTLLLQPLKRE